MTAPYAPQSWADLPATTTPISAARLIVIENGVARYSTVQSSGTNMTARSVLNITGSGVTVSDNSGAIPPRTDVTITAGSGGYSAITDASLTAYPSQSELLFNADFVVSDHGTYTQVDGVPAWDLDINAANGVTKLNHSFVNLLQNSGMEVWTNGTNVAPSGFSVNGSAATVFRSTTSFGEGSYSATVTFNLSFTDQFVQLVNVDFVGEWYTFTARARKISGSGTVQAFLCQDGFPFTTYVTLNPVPSLTPYLVTITGQAGFSGGMRVGFQQTSATGVGSVWEFDQWTLQKGKGVASIYTPAAIDDSTAQTIWGAKSFPNGITAPGPTLNTVNAVGGFETTITVPTIGYSKTTLTADALICLAETQDNLIRDFAFLIEQDSVGGHRVYWAPATVVWSDGSPPQVPQAPGAFMVIEGRWWGTNYGVIAKVTSASQYIRRLSGTTVWNGVTLGIEVDVMRGTRQGNIDALASQLNNYTALAHRQRLGTNGGSLVLSEQWPTDGWNGASSRSADEIYGGFSLPTSSTIAGYSQITGPEWHRTVSDGVTNGTSTVTSATALFGLNQDLFASPGGSDDVGALISGTNIPANTIIQSVTNSTTIVLGDAHGNTVNATGSGSGIALTIQQSPDSIDPTNWGGVIHEYYHLEHNVYFAAPGYTDPGTGVTYSALILHPTTVALYNPVADLIGVAARTVTDGVTNSTTTITSATASFNATNDVGATVSGSGIPPGGPGVSAPTIVSVTNATTAVLSTSATATASGVTLIIGKGVRRVTDGVTSNGSATITSNTANFNAVPDNGAAVTGSGIPGSTTILYIVNNTTAVLSHNATATATGVSLTVTLAGANSVPNRTRTVTDGVTNGTTTITSATASFKFLCDPGAAISGGSIPAGATITTWVNSTTVIISAAAGSSATGVSITIVRTGNHSAIAEWWSQMRTSKHVIGATSDLALRCAGNDSTIMNAFNTWAATTLAIVGG